MRQPFFRWVILFDASKKSNDESVATLAFHAVMVAEHPLELGEMSINKVGRVRYPHLDVVVPGEQ